MTTTIKTFSDATHTTTESTTDTQAIALDWLVAKDVENAATPAKKARTAAGKLLKEVLGKDNTVTVNKGGFRTYVLNVTDSKGRASADKAIEAMVQDGILTQAAADGYLEASRGAHYDTISLKPEKV